MAEETTVPRGKLLIREGQQAATAYFIKAGKVEVFRAVDGAKISIAMLGPGAIVGEMALIDDSPRCASVATVSDITCVMVDRAHMRAMLQASPPLVQHLVRSMVLTVRSFTGRAGDGTGAEMAGIPLLSERTSELLRREIYRPDQIIFTSGAEANTAFLVQSGRVGLFRGAWAEGKGPVAELGPGRVFGELGLLRRTPRTATAIALEQTVCEVVPRDRFETLLKSAPPLVRHLIEAYAAIIERRSNQFPDDEP